MFCSKCGQNIPVGSIFCPTCGTPVALTEPPSARQPPSSQPPSTPPPATQQVIIQVPGTPVTSAAVPYGPPKSKIAAGLFGIFLGSLGVHNFYLGYTDKAVAQLLITILTCGIGMIATYIWGLVEGILILTGSIDRDANGVPLKD